MWCFDVSKLEAEPSMVHKKSTSSSSSTASSKHTLKTKSPTDNKKQKVYSRDSHKNKGDALETFQLERAIQSSSNGSNK